MKISLKERTVEAQTVYEGYPGTTKDAPSGQRQILIRRKAVSPSDRMSLSFFMGGDTSDRQPRTILRNTFLEGRDGASGFCK